MLRALNRFANRIFPTTTNIMPHTLTPAERKALKARAHALDPVVLIGDAGLTPAVMAEIDRGLTVHELIKVRVFGDDRDARLAMRDRIVAELSAEPIQAIGKLLVLFRAAPVVESTSLPRPSPSRASAKTKAGAARRPLTRVSTRKATTHPRPPRTDRVRKSGQRSTKKPHQGR